MKIPSAADIRNWDQYTIEHEPLLSIELMERAATACTKWLLANTPDKNSFHIFCGKGNNGGDGLAIARLLSLNGNKVAVYILEFGHLGTEDFQTNLARLHQHPQVEIIFIQSKESFPELKEGDLIIDALIGSGLNRRLDSTTAELVHHLNSQPATRVAIDIPSGMFVDSSSAGNVMIAADDTLAFQSYKLAFLMAENGPFLGNVHILDIGLHRDYYDKLDAPHVMTDEEFISGIYKPRARFSHKGDHGHALLLAGSYGKTGAAVLAARACLRSGVGLLSCHIPQSAYNIMQVAVPEAMVTTDYNTSFLTKYEEDISKFDSIGIGPGIGTASETKQLLNDLLDQQHLKLVIDADALNIISANQNLLELLNHNTIITPHPKEFERLFGQTSSEFNRINLAIEQAKKYDITIVLKGHHTLIASKNCKPVFNSTGNAGLAKGGTGDVLTGILTALMAQGYEPFQAAVLGVYLHGLSADLACEKIARPSLVASDIIDHLPAAFSHVESIKKRP